MKSTAIYLSLVILLPGISRINAQTPQNFPYGITLGNPVDTFIGSWDAGGGRRASEFTSFTGGLVLYSDPQGIDPRKFDGGVTLMGDPISIVPLSNSNNNSGRFDIWRASDQESLVAKPVFRVDTATNTAEFDSLAVSITNGTISVSGSPVLTSAGATSAGFLKMSGGILSIISTAISTSSTTGALTVAGGIGVAKDSWINGIRIGTGSGIGSIPTLSTALGKNALQSNGSGKNNSAFGQNSLLSNTSGSYNIGIGNDSLKNNSSGYNNTAVGYQTLNDNTAGYWNTAQGYQALYKNSTGYANVATGGSALGDNTTGYWNTAMGITANRYNVSGICNAAFGCASLAYSTIGSQNTAIGAWSLYGITSGESNSALGYSAGRFQADGLAILEHSESSIYIGSGSRGFNNLDHNSIVIGADAVGEGANTTVVGSTDTVSTRLFGETKLESLRVSGQVVIEQAQGDISMGIYGD